MITLPLQKWLSQLGVASLREAERLVAAGRVSVNNKVSTNARMKVNPSRNVICLDGKRLSAKPPRLLYYMLCKPLDVLTSRIDTRGRTTIYELPSVKATKAMLFPVGRLDYRSEGLLLLSNDGELVHRLMHPRYKVPRHYYALVENRLAPSQEAKIRNGVLLDDGPTLPTKLTYVEMPEKGTGAWYTITLWEGRKRIVRRIFKTMGHPVIRLIRFGFGNVRLPGNLAPGELRPLHQQEILHLKTVTKMLS